MCVYIYIYIQIDSCRISHRARRHCSIRFVGVHIYVCVCMYMYTHVYACTYVYMCMYVCMYAYTHMYKITQSSVPVPCSIQFECEFRWDIAMAFSIRFVGVRVCVCVLYINVHTCRQHPVREFGCRWILSAYVCVHTCLMNTYTCAYAVAQKTQQ